MTTTIAAPASETDAAALNTITQHHAELLGTVTAHAADLLDASSSGSLEGASAARRDLVLFCRGEVLPFAIAKEDTVYAAARAVPELSVLTEALIADHRMLAELIDDLAGATTPLGASAAGHALRMLFELHTDKENDFLLPTMAAHEKVSLADAHTKLVELADELAAAATGGGGCGGGCGCSSGGGGCGGGAAQAEPAGGCGCGSGGCGGGAAAQPEPAGGGCGCGGGGCGCGGHDDSHAAAPAAPVNAAGSGRPVLDARQVPHNIRHATVFGALDAVRAGSGLELIAPHDPLPLLAQIEERHPDVFEVSYLERGPEVWRIAFDKKA